MHRLVLLALFYARSDSFCPASPRCDVCHLDDVDLKRPTTHDFPVLRRAWDCHQVLCRLLREPKGGVPPKTPPAELVAQYTMHGLMPIEENYLYDPAANSQLHWNKAGIDKAIAKVRDGRLKGTYGYTTTSFLYRVVANHSSEVRGKHCLVIGSQRPWVESILLAHGASHVTTMEYTPIASHHPNVTTRTPHELATEFVSRGSGAATERPHAGFDCLVTFSSVEHSGLGRYGDALNPFGDLEAMAQAHCMLRPGGFALLNVPFHRGHGRVEWTAHRVYSWERMRLLTANYRILREHHFRGFRGSDARAFTEWLATVFALRRL